MNLIREIRQAKSNMAQPFFFFGICIFVSKDSKKSTAYKMVQASEKI